MKRRLFSQSCEEKGYMFLWIIVEHKSPSSQKFGRGGKLSKC
jgi:hypothetical protein